MTQILTAASWSSVLQVSDRLVTQGTSPLDPFANKTLILVLTNGAVVMSYTGQAFMDEVPTDQWIAEVLRDQRFDRSRKPSAMEFGASLKFGDLGRSLERIRQAISDAGTSGTAIKIHQLGRWYRERFEISFAGWLWYRKARFRPIIGTIMKPPWSLNAQLTYHARSELLCGQFGFQWSPDGYAPRNEFLTLVDTISRLQPSERSKALVSQIRLIARTTPLVGPDCMSVLLPRAIMGPIYVDYFPARVQQAQITGRTGSTQIKVAFSPWIVSEGLCCAPSLVNGENTISLGAFHVIMNGPPSDVSVFAAHQRPVDPSFR